jgi:hypothetical protein
MRSYSTRAGLIPIDDSRQPSAVVALTDAHTMPAMSGGLARSRQSWRFLSAAPPREIFAIVEQMIGTPPFRYEVTGADSARAVEFERKHFLFGNWRALEKVDGDGARHWKPRARPRWVTVRSVSADTGTIVEVEVSKGLGALPRGLQVVYLLSRGNRDRRTIYRDRTTPPGPVTLVASWAGTPYLLFEEAEFSAARGEKVYTATPLIALSNHGPFVKVRLRTGVEGYVERDQLVPAPAEATRAAQVRTAVHG